MPHPFALVTECPSPLERGSVLVYLPSSEESLHRYLKNFDVKWPLTFTIFLWAVMQFFYELIQWST